jgi:anti-anti-sigma factor
MKTLTDAMCPKMERHGDTAIITLAGGRIRKAEDMIAMELETHTDHLEACHLLLDFTHVEFLGSAELGTLIGLNRRMKTNGGRLTLFNLTPRIFEIFKTTHLQTLIGICREDLIAMESAPLFARPGPDAVIASMNQAWFRCPHCQRDWDVHIADSSVKILPSAERIKRWQGDGGGEQRREPITALESCNGQNHSRIVS